MATDIDVEADRPRLRELSTAELTTAEVAAIREILASAFGNDEEERFTEDDWLHGVGGTHFVVDIGGEIVGHASVVERDLHVGDRPLRTGYVEAVAVAPDRQGSGFGSLLLDRVTTFIRDAVRARGPRDRSPPLLRTAGLADLDRADVRANATGNASHAR